MLWHANMDRISPPLPIEILWRSGGMEWAVSWLSRLSGIEHLPQTTPSEVDLCISVDPRTGVQSPSMVMGHPVGHMYKSTSKPARIVDWGNRESTTILYYFGLIEDVYGQYQALEPALFEARPSIHPQKTRWEWPLHRCIAVWNLTVLREAVYTKPLP